MMLKLPVFGWISRFDLHRRAGDAGRRSAPLSWAVFQQPARVCL